MFALNSVAIQSFLQISNLLPCYSIRTMQDSGFNVALSQSGGSLNFIRAGFQLVFDFCTVSIQFGTGNYCDNRHAVESIDGYLFCGNAEVAVFGEKEFVSGWPHSSSSDQVAGWLTPDQVVDVITWARNYKPELSVMQNAVAELPESSSVAV